MENDWRLIIITRAACSYIFVSSFFMFLKGKIPIKHKPNKKTTKQNRNIDIDYRGPVYSDSGWIHRNWHESFWFSKFFIFIIKKGEWNEIVSHPSSVGESCRLSSRASGVLIQKEKTSCRWLLDPWCRFLPFLGYSFTESFLPAPGGLHLRVAPVDVNRRTSSCCCDSVWSKPLQPQ